MNVNDTIYVAGHRGMVGSALVRKLREKGYHRLLYKTREELDLMNQKEVGRFFETEKPDYVFLAAARVGGILANNTYRAQFLYENLQIQNNIIHQSYLHRVKKLLFLGSSCIYPKNCPQPIREEYLLTGELEPTNEPYALAKIAGLKMCEAYNHQYGSDFISVMPTNLYGPNDNYNLETSHVLPALIRKFHLARCLEENNWEKLRADLRTRPVAELKYSDSEKAILDYLDTQGLKIIESSAGKNKIELELWGTGTPRREFMHVDDMADACVSIMERIDARRLNQEMKLPHINVGTGEDIPIAELAETIKKVTGFSGKIKWDANKPDGTPRKLLSVKRLSELEWTYKIKLKDGIQSTYENYSINIS